MSPQPKRFFEFGSWYLDTAGRTLLCRRTGKPVPLAPKAVKTLAVLVENRGQVVTKEELMRAIWPDTFVEEAGLARNISVLRKALGDTEKGSRYIETIPKRGYRFIGPVAERKLEADGGPEAHTLGSDELTAAGSEGNAGRAITVPRRLRLWSPWVAAGIVLAAGYFFWRHSHARPHTATGRIMLAVLPFENLSGDPGQEYFSDGLTEEMIAQLGVLNPGRLGVIARTSVMAFKHSGIPIDGIGRRLGVQYLLEGSVRRASNRVRITAQLIQASDQTHLWAETYDRDLKDILAVQSEVARAIATQIEARLTPEEHARLVSSARPVKPAAYEAYLKGRFAWSQATEKGHQEGLQHFQ